MGSLDVTNQPFQGGVVDKDHSLVVSTHLKNVLIKLDPLPRCFFGGVFFFVINCHTAAAGLKSGPISETV